jgi:AAA domain/UvrD-like helicase C-terminal domain
VSQLKGVIEALAAGLREAGHTAVFSMSKDRPHISVLDKHRGLIAVYVQDPWNGETVEEANQQLNLRLAAYRDLLPDDFQPVLKRFVFTADKLPAAAVDQPRRVKKISGSWLDALPKREMSGERFTAIREFLVPADYFAPRMYEAQTDDNLQSRIEARFALDKEQHRLGMMRVRDVMVVTGPAGSGKSLILAARAKRLATEHPDWKIQVLCFNHGLVPYLEYIMGEHENVSVQQFGKFHHALGHRFSMGTEADIKSMEQYQKAKEKGIEISYDALLVDEMQDFAPGWIQFALDGLFPNRGGAVLVGDLNQSLYRESNLEAALTNHHVIREHLHHPYRSTREILKVISLLDPSLTVEGEDLVPEGAPKPELVYANGVQAAARAIRFDIQNLLEEPHMSPGDIGVLCLSSYGIAPIRNALRDAGIPVQASWQPRREPLELDSDSVKVITINHAKGIEFKAVCLYGLDELKDPDEPGLDSEEHASRLHFERINLVGPSRAKDRLYIYYRKPNRFVKRLFKSGAVNEWTYPDDYSGES